MFTLRKGQSDLEKSLPGIQRGDVRSVHWPTGYGKSIGFALAWKHCHKVGLANRFLLVVANDTQRQQIINDFCGDCKAVGAPCEGGIWSFEKSAGDLLAARKHTAEVFVCSVQHLEASNRGGVNLLRDMLTSHGTSWMLGFDEFHHYAEDMPWGDAAKSAMTYSAFTLAMSATPYRRGADTVFPEPDQSVTYQKAVEEGAVKTMVCHSYDYRVTVEDSEGTREYTTSELMQEAPEGLDSWEERRNIRYSPEYIHPLILHPLSRLSKKRATSGAKLQMLVRAMSCSHARMVCEQIRTFGDGVLSVDWIGTGDNGRKDFENRRIIESFCPPKSSGVRPSPSLDVLVQVSMAGEGFDSINVAEIVDLFPVSNRAASGTATADKQFYGRGSRVVPGAKDIALHVNVPSDHPLHTWAGNLLHVWMDSSGNSVLPTLSDKEPLSPNMPDIDMFSFPAFPRRREIELLDITTESPHFRQTVSAWAEHWPDMENPEHADKLLDLYRNVMFRDVSEKSEQARIAQAKEHLQLIVGHVAKAMAYVQTGEKTGPLYYRAVGPSKKRVNGRIKKQFKKSREEMQLNELELAHTFCENWLTALRNERR